MARTKYPGMWSAEKRSQILRRANSDLPFLGDDLWNYILNSVRFVECLVLAVSDDCHLRKMDLDDLAPSLFADISLPTLKLSKEWDDEYDEFHASFRIEPMDGPRDALKAVAPHVGEIKSVNDALYGIVLQKLKSRHLRSKLEARLSEFLSCAVSVYWEDDNTFEFSVPLDDMRQFSSNFTAFVQEIKTIIVDWVREEISMFKQAYVTSGVYENKTIIVACDSGLPEFPAVSKDIMPKRHGR